MKLRKTLLLLTGCLCCLLAEAQIRGNEISVVVSPDRADWTYKTGEKATFTIQVIKAQNALENAKIDYELGPEWYPVEKKEGVMLKGGKLKVSGTMKTPGFLRCKVKAYVGERTYDGMATAAYSPADINPCAKMPVDFEAFWNSSIEKARKTPLLPTMELLPGRCTDRVNVYHVSFQNVRYGSRTYAILCVPKKAGKYPALLRVPGAGVRPYNGDTWTAAEGAITLEIGIHGVPVNMPQSVYDDLSNGALSGYPYFNDNSRDRSYYYRVFLSVLRAIDFICTLPEFDGKTLGVTGSSQGGALSMVAAALDKRVTFYAAIHPAMCDHRGHLQKRAGGWPHYFRYFPNPDEKRLQMADYYDMVNFARLIKIPGWYSWGYNDEVCPPTSTYAAYNTVIAPKELHPYLQTGHFLYTEQNNEWNKWLRKQLGL